METLVQDPSGLREELLLILSGLQAAEESVGEIEVFCDPLKCV